MIFQLLLFTSLSCKIFEQIYFRWILLYIDFILHREFFILNFSFCIFRHILFSVKSVKSVKIFIQNFFEQKNYEVWLGGWERTSVSTQLITQYFVVTLHKYWTALLNWTELHCVDTNIITQHSHQYTYLSYSYIFILSFLKNVFILIDDNLIQSHHISDIKHHFGANISYSVSNS